MPDDVTVASLAHFIDASPRRDWLTSGEREREARRLIDGMKRWGFDIVDKRNGKKRPT